MLKSLVKDSLCAQSIITHNNKQINNERCFQFKLYNSAIFFYIFKLIKPYTSQALYYTSTTSLTNNGFK